MKNSKTMLGVGMFVALFSSSAAIAQDTNSESTTAPQLETMTVTGIRGSLTRSINSKRSNSAITDVISAEDIGDFAATNVAEALTHAPGVTIDQNMPGLQKVSINGLDPNLNITLLNGHPVAQAIILFAQSPNRGFNFSLLPAQIVGSLEIYKSYEAKLPAGGLGGTILVHTRDPLDLEANTIAGSVGYLYNEQSSEGAPKAAIFYSTHNDAGTFGYNIAVQHFENPINRQGLEVFAYDQAKEYPGVSGTFTPDALVPQELNSAFFSQDLKRNSIYFNTQWQPTASFSSALKLFYLRTKADNVNQSVYGFTSSTKPAVTSLGSAANGIIQTGHVRGTACTMGGPACGPASTKADIFARASDFKTKGADLQLTYARDDWDVSLQLGANESSNDLRQYYKQAVYAGGYTFYSQSGNDFDQPDQFRDLKFWNEPFNGYYYVKPYDTHQKYLDIDYSVNLPGFFNQFLAGIRYSKHRLSQQYLEYITLPDVSPTKFLGGITDLSGISEIGGTYDAAHFVKRAGFDATVAAVESPMVAQQVADGDFFGPNFYNNSVSQTRERKSAFVQANFDNDSDLRGNVGLRFVDVQNASTGWKVPATCKSLLPSELGSCNVPKFGEIGFVTEESSTSEALPAATVVYNLTDDLLLRVAAAKTLGFNPYVRLVNNFTSNVTTLTATSGNSDLKPYESVNTSVAVEWYFDQASLLSASLFNYDITNYIVTKTVNSQRYNPLFATNRTQALQSSVIQNNCNMTTGFCNFAVTKPFNGGDATVRGFTLGYQQSYGGTGFGLRASYTYSDGEVGSGGSLPYNSENSYVISPFYDKGPIEASISYTWRSSYTAAGYVAGAAPNVVDDYKSLSATVSYAFNDHLALELSGLNLLNSTYYQHGSVAYNQLFTKYKTGSVYTLTFRANF